MQLAAAAAADAAAVAAAAMRNRSRNYISHEAGSQFRTARGAAQALWREGGASIFWRGNVSGMGLYASYMAVQFPMFEAVKRALHGGALRGQGVSDDDDDDAGKEAGLLGIFGSDALAGACASAGATVLTHPFDWARTLMAGQRGEGRYSTGMRAAWEVSVVRREPWLMWRGAGVAAVSVAP